MKKLLKLIQIWLNYSILNFKNHSEFYRSRNLTGYQVTAKEYKLLVEASNLSIEDLTLPMYHEVIKAAKFYQFCI